MSQKDSDVRHALIEAAQEFLTSGENTLPLSAIVFENRISDAAQNHELWSSIYFRPNSPEARTIGQCGIDRATGFLQIDFNIAQGKGEGDLIDWEDEAREFFAPGNTFEAGEVSVLVIQCGMGQGRIVSNNFRKSLTVSYRADLIRKTKTN